MGDRLRAGIPPWYVTRPTRSTQPCINVGSLNRVPALIGWGKGGNVTSAGWQVTPCDPIWHVSSRSGAELVAQTAIRFLTLHNGKKLSGDFRSVSSEVRDKVSNMSAMMQFTITIRIKKRTCIAITAANLMTA